MIDRLRMHRRQLLTGSACLAVLPGVAGSARAQGPARRHAMSLVGEPQYAADFKHFAWVNPNAPKGGRVRQYVEGSFDSLNPFPVQGEKAPGLGLLNSQLFVASPDEPSTEYAMVAEWATYPDDYASVTFGLRAQAKFHDGRVITPEDVVWSFDTLKRIVPLYNSYYKDVEKAEKSGEREVTFRFSTKNNRELPHIMSQLVVLPKHWWEGTNAKGETRDIARSSLEPPLGSGPYRIKSFEANREITYERVKDWWAKDLPVAMGQYNFDDYTLVMFRDRVPAFESFKAGQLDFWRETSAKAWATEYEFDAAKKGLVKQHKIPITRVAPMQAFVMNLRRPMFQDVRVRRAMNLAFDFEWANKNLFYDQYIRVGSYFDNSEFAAKGLPQGRELEHLNDVKSEIPPEVFTTEWKNPVNPTPEDARKNLGQASRLLADAGYTAKGGILSNAKGQQLAFEILLQSPSLTRIVEPYVNTLKRLGIAAAVRVVDSAQYQRRTDQFDFDVIWDGFAQSESPGNEQRDFWGSAAADKDGSRNSVGIKNPAIDKLVEKVVFAKDRADLVAATRALDRVLLWNHYVVPMWHLPYDRIAVWNQYGRPEIGPRRATSFTQTWWYDAAAAEKLRAARGF
jgi:microcin C transport system substrate-binding protein